VSVNPTTGRHECDCCGVDLLGGGVAQCVVVSDLDPDRRGAIRNLEFCRDRTESGEEIRGCEHKLLNPATIRHYTDRQEAAGA
jgi:hypothetical protein